MRVYCSDGKVVIEQDKEENVIVTDKPLEVVKKIMKDYQSPKIAGMPPLNSVMLPRQQQRNRGKQDDIG